LLPPGRRQPSICSVGRRDGVRLHAGGDRFANGARRRGRGRDGRRASTVRYNLPTRTRAAHRALEFKWRLASVLVEFGEIVRRCLCLTSSRWRCLTPHLVFQIRRCQTVSQPDAATREASSPPRKTTRKPPKAARAAGRGRAPQDASLPPRGWQEPKEPDSPQRPGRLSNSSPVWRGPGVGGAFRCARGKPKGAEGVRG